MTIADDVETQVEQCLRNIAAALAEAGCTSECCPCALDLPNAADFPKCWPALRQAFGTARPAATMMAAGLADPAC